MLKTEKRLKGKLSPRGKEVNERREHRRQSKNPGKAVRLEAAQEPGKPRITPGSTAGFLPMGHVLPPGAAHGEGLSPPPCSRTQGINPKRPRPDSDPWRLTSPTKHQILGCCLPKQQGPVNLMRLSPVMRCSCLETVN